MFKSLDRKRKLQWILFVLSFLLLLFFFLANDKDDIYELNSSTEDGIIHVTWKNPAGKKNDKVKIAVYSNDHLFTVELLDRKENEYLFDQGNNGDRYSFHVSLIDKDGKESAGQDCVSTFLRFGDTNDLATIVIRTGNGLLPVFDERKTPDDMWGMTIDNNTYLDASFELIRNGDRIYDEKAQIRVRGNTSAFHEKTPYKVRLSRDTAIFNGENIEAGREYVLLGNAINLNFPFGTFVARKTMDLWEPAFEYVNLIINGDYRGCYLLTETIDRGENKVNISDNGALFENDGYWWSDKNHFKSKHQIAQMGYTFVYPQNATELNIADLKKQIETFEDLLYKNDEGYENYIDMDSFVSWVLSQDLIGNLDQGGSNMYLYVDDLKDPDRSKICMGPLWDFDEIFREEHLLNYAKIHDSDVLYYDLLFQQGHFNELYVQKWISIRDEIKDAVASYLSEIDSGFGTALQNGWNYDANRFHYSPADLQAAEKRIIDWFAKKTEWMNENVR